MPASSQPFLLFEAGQLCAIPVAAVVRVMARPPVIAIPFSRPPLMGAVNAAGEILPVFDTASLLGVRDPLVANELIVITGKPDRLGLLVGRVRQTSLLPASSSAERSSGSAEAKRQLKWRDRDVTLFDPAADYLSGSVYDFPDAGADISLGFAAKNLQQAEPVPQLRSHDVLNVGSGCCSFDVPFGMVLGLRAIGGAEDGAAGRSADLAPPLPPPHRSGPVISLADLSGAGSMIAEEIGIDVVIASRHATLTVERATRLSRKGEVEHDFGLLERLRLAMTMEAV